VARELFGEKGVQRTSLKDIADRLGITKPALYYHFSSREDLVRSIMQPLVDDGEQLIDGWERRGDATPREILEGYFDYLYRHRGDLVFAASELSTLAELGLIDQILAWRVRLGKLLFGPRPTLVQATRAVIAFGGLQDCCLQFRDAPRAALRRAAVDGGLAALGV
jgi:AcrR family transcriptional regulator